MKMFLIALAFCLSLFGAQKAEAGVPCSVPFNLTNGTTADASQVMANYNAILTCLANNAAASGQNTDITALLGLTNPITPLCGANGYTAINNAISPNSVLNIAAAVATMNTTSGLSVARSNVSLQLNFAVNGANGLDTGSVGATLPYYIWLIDNGTTPAALASLSSTAPTLPSGYTYSCRLSAVPTDGSSHLLGISTAGQFTTLTSTLLNASGNTGSCVVTLTQETFAQLPLTITQITGYLLVGGAHTAAVGYTTTQTAVYTVGVTSLSTSTPFNMPLLTAQSIFYCANVNSSGAEAFITGWTDNTNAH